MSTSNFGTTPRHRKSQLYCKRPILHCVVQRIFGGAEFAKNGIWKEKNCTERN